MLTRTLPAQGPGAPLVTRSTGSINLTPQKYWRLIRKKETRKKVGADYVFPEELTGDIVQLVFVQDIITKARLEIYEEIINTDEDPLQGADADKYAPLSIYESIVPDGSPRDSGFLVKESRVTPLGNGKSIKITVMYPEDLASRFQTSQDFDAEFGAPIIFKERIAPANSEIGDLNKKIDSMDFERELVTEIDNTAMAALAATFFRGYESRQKIDLPDVLFGYEGFRNGAQANGSYAETGSGAGAGGTWFVSVNASGEGESSASLSMEVAVYIDRPRLRDLLITEYFFLLLIPTTGASVGKITEAAILEALSDKLSDTVLQWPDFNPVEKTIEIFSQKKSGRLRVKASRNASANSDGGASVGSSVGHGYSSEVTTGIGMVKIPPTINELIGLSGYVNEIEAISAAASADAGAGVSISDTIAAHDSFAYAQAFISPTEIEASNGATSIPNTGLYLMPGYKSKPSTKAWGYAWVYAPVVNFAQ